MADRRDVPGIMDFCSCGRGRPCAFAVRNHGKATALRRPAERFVSLAPTAPRGKRNERGRTKQEGSVTFTDAVCPRILSPGRSGDHCILVVARRPGRDAAVSAWRRREAAL